MVLGAAEAGFFPGIIFFLTLWFPSVYRGRAVGMFMAAIPASTIIGGPFSTWILGLDGTLGLHGWQWLFIIEALPALVLSVFVLTYLTDWPAKAHWLADDERAWLSGRLAAERQARQARHDISVLQALGNRQVLALSAVYFGLVSTNYGTAFWLPQIIKAFGGLSNFQIGVITAIPYAIGMVGMVLWGRRSDNKLERKGHAAIALACAALGIGLSALIDDPVAKMVVISIGIFGVFAVLPVFWTLPTAFLSGAAAAAGIAVINSIGNLAGFAGPYAMGFLKDATGTYMAGLLLIAALALMSMVIVLSLHHDRTLEHAPEGQPAE
jgi:sugar phosphate permease